MGQEEVNKIKARFLELNLHPIYLEHEDDSIRSEDAAKSRGFELKQGIKSMLFTNGEEWVIVNLPADKKIDFKKVAAQNGWSNSKTRIGNEEEVMEKTGCKIGAVPPFGHKEEMKILVDKGVYDNEVSTFNIGLREVSVKIPTEEMKVVFNDLNAFEGDFVKE